MKNDIKGYFFSGVISMQNGTTVEFDGATEAISIIKAYEQVRSELIKQNPGCKFIIRQLNQ